MIPHIDEYRLDLCQLCLQNDCQTRATTERAGVPLCDIDAKVFDQWYDEEDSLDKPDWQALTDLKDWDGTMW